MSVQLQSTLRLAACILCLLTFYVAAARASDAANGERIAVRWCASCHAIGREQPKSRTEAAAFAAIARKAEFNERSLTFFLLDPHPAMPDMNLTRAEATDLAAYIATLRN